MKIRYSSHISWQRYIDAIYVFNKKIIIEQLKKQSAPVGCYSRKG